MLTVSRVYTVRTTHTHTHTEEHEKSLEYSKRCIVQFCASDSMNHMVDVKRAVAVPRECVRDDDERAVWMLMLGKPVFLCTMPVASSREDLLVVWLVVL